MLRSLLLLFACLSLGLLFALAESVRRPLARLIRGLLLGLVCVLGLVGLAVGTLGLENESWVGAVVGGAILLVAGRLGWALRRRHRPAAGEPDHVPLTRSARDPRWQRFEAQLDWLARKEVQRSRTAIEHFLQERESASLTQEHRALLLSCEKRVPELIDACLERCRNARGRERERYIAETLARLEQIGRDAERARREVREADDLRLKTLHNYFDSVTANSGGPPERP